MQIACLEQCRLRRRLNSRWELRKKAMNRWLFAQQRAQSLVLASLGKGELPSANVLDDKGESPGAGAANQVNEHWETQQELRTLEQERDLSSLGL